jgi:two-component system OmpR family response regulator
VKIARGGLLETRVLIVDVDRKVHDRLSRALSFTGALVFSASGRETALRQVKRVEPDLIILDISSPDSDRWETLVEIRRLPYIPVIALTTPDDVNSIVESLRYGADYSMTKPVRERELRARIRALLRRTRRAASAQVAA